MKNIIILGIQGCGKGTQAKKILEKYSNYVYFEAGNILRTLKMTDNPLGNYIKLIIDKGGIVDGGFINSIFDAYLFILNENEYMLLDGFPRTFDQMFVMLDKLKKIKKEVFVIYLDLPEYEAIKRISSRRICKNCQKVYNINIDGDINNCLICGQEIIFRHDDKPEIVKQRIDLYFQQTMPVIKYFQDMGRFIKIDATKGQDEIFVQIKEFIEN